MKMAMELLDGFKKNAKHIGAQERFRVPPRQTHGL